MSLTIYSKMQEYIAQDPYPFHMPGHKRNPSFLPSYLLSYDITEVSDVDNLHHPNGIILQSQQKIAALLGADNSFICVNGGSSGVLASILATCREGDKLLLARNSHKSAYNGLVLSGASPVYIYPEITPYNICGGISPHSVEYALSKDSNIKTVLITSPTYEGFTSDISSIADIVHKYNAVLIVDETHGAHFCFSDKFPAASLSCGADITIQSWHKTLPTLNQSAVINIKGNRISSEAIQTALSMVQTTSPSYIIMTVMDYCRKYLTDNPQLFKEYLDNLLNLRNMLSSGTLPLIGTDLIGSCAIADYDISKLVFYINSDFSGKRLENILLKEYNLQIELSGLHHIIAMTSVADTQEGFNRLASAVKNIADKSVCTPIINTILPSPITDEPIISPRQAHYLPKHRVPLTQSVGKLSGEFITPYPPDIPILAIGEAITSDIVSQVMNYRENGITVIGAENNFINIIEV